MFFKVKKKWRVGCRGGGGQDAVPQEGGRGGGGIHLNYGMFFMREPPVVSKARRVDAVCNGFQNGSSSSNSRL